MQQLIKRLRSQNPELRFQAGKAFFWSPKTKTVTYVTSALETPVGSWSLLHELGHALLDHTTYNSDLELLMLEVAAWDKANQLAKGLDVTIDNEHVQDCLDTYRDWLHQRSTCPTCGNQSLQQDSRTYRCFNCRTTWKVSMSRFCRPYRRLAPIKTSLAGHPKQAMFR